MEIISLKINGEQVSFYGDKNDTLLHTLREKLELTGTKCGCNTGSCGACMVIIDGKAVRSCLVKLKSLPESEIQTIEGMSDGVQLHPIQQAFVDVGAVQCGFCTPGMIMSAKALLDENPNPTEIEVRLAIEQNLCRCTGYEKIVEAILLAGRRMGGVSDGQ